MSGLRIASVVGVIPALCAVALLARAQAPSAKSVIVEWSGPSDCASVTPLENELSRLLADGTASASPLRVAARVERLASGGYRLVLETADETRRFRRALEAASCDGLIKPAAVILALAVDPEAMQRALNAPEAPPDAGQNPGTEPSEAASDAAAPLAAGSVSAAPADVPPPPVATAPSFGSAAVDRGKTSVARERGPTASLASKLELQLDLAADLTTLPGPSFGPNLALALELDRFRLEAGGVYLFERSATVDPERTKGGDMDLLATYFGACFLNRRAVELGLCGGFEFGRLHGRGFGVTDIDSTNMLWLAVRAGALVQQAVSKNFAISFRTDALVRIGGSEFTIEGIGPVHQPALFGARVLVGAAMSFR